MRKIVLLLVGCLALAGCGGSEWREKVRFKVVKIFEVEPQYDRKYAKVRLELVGEMPDDVLEPVTLTPYIATRSDFYRFEVKVGDEVLCWVKQVDELGYTRTSVIDTDLSSCEKA